MSYLRLVWICFGLWVGAESAFSQPNLAELLDRESQTTAPDQAVIPGDARPSATEKPGSGDETAATPDNRLPAPSASDRAKALAKIDSVFTKEFASAKTADAKSSLANDLLELAENTNDPAERFALLETALRLADEAGASSLVMDILATTQKIFRIDLASRRRQSLVALSKRTTPADSAEVTRQLVAEANAVLDSADVAAAAELAAAAGVASRRGRDSAARQEVAGLLAEIKTIKRIFPAIEQAVAGLGGDPKNPDYCATVGKFLCFHRNQWDRGLPLLTAGSDQHLALVAQKELIGARSSAEHVALAEQWTAVATAQPDEMQGPGLEQALNHYEQAAKAVDGLEGVQIAKKISELQARLYDDNAQRWLVLFRSADPTIWNSSTARGPNDFAEPLARTPPGVRYVRLRRSVTECVILPITQAELGKTVVRERFGWQGSKEAIDSAIPLGVIDFRKTTRGATVAINLYMSADRQTRCSGWGFGANANVMGSPLAIVWDGTELPNAPLEISVTTHDLSATERHFLLQ